MIITDNADHWIIAASSVVTTAMVQRFFAYLAKALPPLGANAGWFSTFAYNLLKNATGIDPNSTTLSPTAMSALPPALSQQVARAASVDKAAS